MGDDRPYYEGLLGSVEALYGEELAWQEAHWGELDEFMRSEYLGVTLVDADRRLGALQEAADAGTLPEDLVGRVRSVEALVREAQPRVARLRDLHHREAA